MFIIILFPTIILNSTICFDEFHDNYFVTTLFATKICTYLNDFRKYCTIFLNKQEEKKNEQSRTPFNDILFKTEIITVMITITITENTAIHDHFPLTLYNQFYAAFHSYN